MCTFPFSCDEGTGSSEEGGSKAEVFASDEGGTSKEAGGGGAAGEAGNADQTSSQTPTSSGEFPTGFPGENRDNAGTAKGFLNEDLQDVHFGKHGGDFGALTPEEYVNQANTFLSGFPAPNEVQLMRTNGDIVRLNRSTNEFGIITSEGIVRTYFEPNPAITGRSNLQYFLDQYW
jgi:hypothetical protein